MADSTAQPAGRLPVQPLPRAIRCAAEGSVARYRVPKEEVEKYSSACTLSDMEIFIFPDLLYALVLANLMSPRVWEWRNDPWFERLDRMSPVRRLGRLRQFIMDHYEFNLDLDTWGLTTKERELARFREFMDEATIARSNALFGYEGDRYYFDIDIRRHFGLDKYEGNVIPYWKTETVEAMDAFRFKPGYSTGAGECVSLSTLYAVAMFLVAGIPLEDIFLIGTPLHSQNFVLVGDGVLTNNRRLLTRTMWFNGTELSYKAQRALRYEQVTIVAHVTGWIHCVYPVATIDPAQYGRFARALRKFLHTPITMGIVLNFLRQYPDRQRCFQLRHVRHGRTMYIPAEVVYHYEHSSPCRINDASRERLLNEIDDDEFYPLPIPGRILLDDIEAVFRHAVDPRQTDEVRRLLEQFGCEKLMTSGALDDLIAFAHIEPRLPQEVGAPIEWKRYPALPLRPDMPREEVLDLLSRLRSEHPVADLAWYAYRDLSATDWLPFVKAAVERSPVSIAGAEGLDDLAVEARLREWPDESIYDGPRCAQPDEVWNYRRGDGLEKALCLLNVLAVRHPAWEFDLEVHPDHVVMSGAGHRSVWASSKGLRGFIQLSPAAA